MQVSRPGASKATIDGGGTGPLPERVEAAAIEIRAVVLDVIGVGQLVPEPGRLVRLHRRPADPLDQQPAEAQRLVADHLGRQPEPRPARQQAVLGIARDAPPAVTRDDCRYVALVTISRSMALTSQPERTNSVASQSSSSGWLGGSPWAPKSSTVFTSPVPKSICQSRLTATRAVSGLAGSTSQRARPSRSGRRRRGQRRKTGRDAGLDPRPGLVVLAADQDVRRRGAGSSSMTIVVGMRSTSSSTLGRARVGSASPARRIAVGGLGRQEALAELRRLAGGPARRGNRARSR